LRGRYFAFLGVVWAMGLGMALALTVLAARITPLPGDGAVLRWLQRQPLPGQLASEVIRTITTTQVVLATGGVMVAALAIMGRKRQAIALLCLLVALPLLQWGLKEGVDRPRPGPPLAELRASYTSPSFPAGHVMSPTALYIYLLGLAIGGMWPGLVRGVTVVWSALLIPLSGPPNVWLGVHWPSDVLGGWAWGLVLALPALGYGITDKAHHLMNGYLLPMGVLTVKLGGDGGGPCG
jgi:membrane-associated phospholipid phosphatase